MENVWNIHIALQETAACAYSLNHFRFAFDQVLDGDTVGRDSWDKQGVLDAWNSLPDLLEDAHNRVLEAISHAEQFTETEHFWQLDWVIKWHYWDSIQDTKTALNNLLSYWPFYQLLSQIEHTEQTIHFLWDKYRSTQEYVTVLSIDGVLSEEEEEIYWEMLPWLKGRIGIEFYKFIRLLERAIAHPVFDMLDGERRELYHAKWHVYLGKFADLDRR